MFGDLRVYERTPMRFEACVRTLLIRTHQARIACYIGSEDRGETTFEREGDGWRAAAGRERGERLRIDGGQLVWSGYAFTRAQEPFKA